jgi:hypothetical protein
VTQIVIYLQKDFTFLDHYKRGRCKLRNSYFTIRTRTLSALKATGFESLFKASVGRVVCVEDLLLHSLPNDDKCHSGPNLNCK